MVEGTGFEPVYAMRSDLQSDAFNHSATPPKQDVSHLQKQVTWSRNMDIYSAMSMLFFTNLTTFARKMKKNHKFINFQSGCVSYKTSL